ncbi:hypothetical protein [Capnocytophaga gingivalis]|uniref:hypothetical protein n=1 Tax=Capnocytophaga gingivalis TaxID=1017 RepID=UPI00019FA36B|nr:hypothetical protein [Capnocytophaga gingivalis]EEK14948.1 hypothetical protein CAPGI0001_1358 [Capnocytophaga gingivalis ATCC 33624]
MKSFLRKDARSFYFVFCLLFFVAVVIYYLVREEKTSLLNTILLLSVALLNVCSAGYSLYDVRKRESITH